MVHDEEDDQEERLINEGKLPSLLSLSFIVRGL
jgi:hypothetical protein